MTIMRRKRAKIWLLAAAGGLVLGCQSASVRNGYPEDPLLLSKKPVEGKPGKAESVQVVHAEPKAPTLPPTELASNPAAPGATPRPEFSTVAGKEPRPTAPVTTAAAPKEPVQAIPVSRPQAPAEAPPAPPVPRQVPGTYGHGPDYTWLQGILVRQSQGRPGLRYCDPAAVDAWGGQVILEQVPGLAQFQEGDVLYVEGELVRSQGEADHGGWNYCPHYRVREVRLVKRGS
jgi:hypothetical protein